MNDDFKVDYIGIGVRRGGTSWIQQCLAEHPQICVAKKKELAFLNDPNQYQHGVEAYKAWFPECKKGQIRGEYTPGYLASEDAIHMIKKWFPEAKLLVCLRNPVERAYSNYLAHKTTEKTRAKTFEQAIKDPALKPYYIDTGFYYTQLKKWLAVHPKEKFLILIHDDIAKDPLKFIQGIYRFLGVDYNFIPPSAKQEINWPAKNSVKIPFLNLAITNTKRFFFQHPKSLKPAVVILRLLKINKLLESVRQANYRKKNLKRYEKPPLPEETRKYLQEIYREEIKNLEKLLNRDLSFWV